jgi:AcrR family transcriptional regulator
MLRDRLLDAAADAFREEGWRRLTMAKIADRAGVSRQTVYNEFGTKQQMAEQLIMRELETFLAIVSDRFAAEDEFVPAVRSAVEGALVTAQRNPLLRSVLESEQNGDADLLPIIVQSQWLVDRASAFQSVVRLVLSHITRPSRSPEETADDMAFIVAAVLAGAPEVTSDIVPA